MHVYLAAAYSRYPEMQEIAKRLRSYDIFVTSRWITGEHENKETNPIKKFDESRRFAMDDIIDINKSDVILWFSSNDGQSKGRGGRHVEFGYAIACGIPIFVIGHRENVFHYLDGVNHFDTIEDFISSYQKTLEREASQ